MPDAGTIRQQVQARIVEIEAILGPLRTEYDQLKALAATFAAGPTAASAAAPPRRSRRAAGAPAAAGRRSAKPSTGAPGASRADQALELVTANPGITAADMAKAMGISRNYLYRVLPKLEQRGVVTKHGVGYRLAQPPAG